MFTSGVYNCWSKFTVVHKGSSQLQLSFTYFYQFLFKNFVNNFICFVHNFCSDFLSTTFVHIIFSQILLQNFVSNLCSAIVQNICSWKLCTTIVQNLCPELLFRAAVAKLSSSWQVKSVTLELRVALLSLWVHPPTYTRKSIFEHCTARQGVSIW